MRKKPRKRDQALGLFKRYLQFKAVSKGAKGARKGAKGVVVYKSAGKLRWLPVLGAVGVAGAVAAKRRSGGTTGYEPPTPAAA